MPVFEYLVYTIIKSEKIEQMLATGETVFVEKKIWRSACNFLQEAKSKKQTMYLVLAPAETTRCLYAYAKIESLEILETEKSTKITFADLRRFVNGDIPKTELVKIDGKPVAQNYIRPYLVCQTSSVIKYIEAEPKIPILDLTKGQFQVALEDKNFLSEAELEAINYARQKDVFSAAELAEHLGYKDYNAANLLVGNLGKKIANYYSVDLSRKSKSPGWWRIVCDGEYREGTFYWWVKKEFLEALVETGWLSDTAETSAENAELLQTEFIEGSKKLTTTNRYERNREARTECLKYYGAVCCVCGFDFEKTYGKIGKGFIHVHHEVEISQIGSKYKVDPVKDLKPVCPNCHAMLHQKRPAYTVGELQDILIGVTNYDKTHTRESCLLQKT